MTRDFQCSCGATVSAGDVEALVVPVREHFATAHPEMGLTDTSIRNYLEAEDRLTGPLHQIDRVGNIEIRPIAPDIVEELAEFFDHRVFAGNPAWAACYCMFDFLGGQENPDWGRRTWQENRADLLGRVARGGVTGVVAHVDGVLAGWCNATARPEFPSLSRGEDEGAASIVCFAIAPPYRGHGLAEKLLEGAIDELRRLGFRRAEGYPGPDRHSRAFRGWPELFLAAGFSAIGEGVMERSL